MSRLDVFVSFLGFWAGSSVLTWCAVRIFVKVRLNRFIRIVILVTLIGIIAALAFWVTGNAGVASAAMLGIGQGFRWSRGGPLET